MRRFVVLKPDAQKRLDVYVAEKFAGLSRAFIKKLDDEGRILVNKQQQKSGYKLKEGDQVSVDYSAKDIESIPDIDLPILYEDEDCIVIDKPIGVLSHSKGAFNPEATVATFLHPKYQQFTPDFARTRLATRLNLAKGREGIVHRLDRATSGVMICAKNPGAMSWLQKQFSSRKVKKTYMAVVTGHLREDKAIIDMPIERNPRKPQTFRTGANGKAAVTAYEVVGTNNKYSLIKLNPQTGRTHQLRVHLSKIGHPIVGDVLYHGEPANRLLLHAQQLEITIPSGSRKVFEAPLPVEFTRYIK